MVNHQDVTLSYRNLNQPCHQGWAADEDINLSNYNDLVSRTEPLPIEEHPLPRSNLEVSKASPATSNIPGRIPEEYTPKSLGRVPGISPDEPRGHSSLIPDDAIQSVAKMIYAIWPEPSQSAINEFPEFCELYTNIKHWNLPNFLGARIHLKTDLNIPAWKKYLANYHDQLLCQYLQFGWPVGFIADKPPETVVTNHQSAESNKAHVEKYITTELGHEALIGPFKDFPFIQWCRLSPLMTRDKKDSSDKRIIVDLSFPENASVNDYIDPANHLGCDVTYTLPTIVDLITQLQENGSGSYLWKADLSRAYRQLRVDPLDTPLLGIRVGSDIYLDLCPPFGCRTSAAFCQKVANAIVYILRKENHNVLAYLDDYGGCHPNIETAQATYKRFKMLAKELGLTLAEHKCQPPTTNMEWLGYTLNTIEMSVTIPQTKLTEVLQECEIWLTRTRASKKMIQKIVGKLIFISNCVQPGRKFVTRILATLSAMHDRTWTTVDDTFRADIRWFYEYAKQANGVYLCSTVKDTCEIECDSSLTAGAGTTNEHYYVWEYNDNHLKKFPHIYQLEAVNLVLAYKTLAPTFKACPANIVVWTDNAASSYALQTGRTKDQVLGACARELWLQASKLQHNIEIRHKSGALLVLPDALSRMFQDKEKRKLASSLISLKALKSINPVLDNYKFFDTDL